MRENNTLKGNATATKITDKASALGWNDVLENDGAEYTVLPEGEYRFQVVGFERGSFPGSDKMCACNKAQLKLQIISGQGTVIVYDDLILHKKMEWRLSSFFRSIGQKKKGERITMNWNTVPGSEGYAYIVVNKYTDKNGNVRQNNKVGKYLDYDIGKMLSEDEFDDIPEDISDLYD